MRWLSVSAGAMILTAAVLSGSSYGAAASTAHRGILLPRHPARSMAPGTPLLSSCSAGDNGEACNQMALTAIGAARQTLEKMGGMSLSLPAYAKLTPARQLFVVVNLERTERGLAPNILNRFGQASCVLAMGRHATAARGYRESDTVLMVGVCGHAPTDAVFTWARAKKLLHIR
jgi:hypothetical protein